MCDPKEDNSEWSLSAQNVAQYRQHVQARITDDLQESLNHLDEHHEQLQSLLQKLDLAKKQVMLQLLFILYSYHIFIQYSTIDQDFAIA